MQLTERTSEGWWREGDRRRGSGGAGGGCQPVWAMGGEVGGDIVRHGSRREWDIGNTGAEGALSPHRHRGRGELSFDLSVQFLKSWGHLDTVLSLVQAVSRTEGLSWQPGLAGASESLRAHGQEGRWHRIHYSGFAPPGAPVQEHPAETGEPGFGHRGVTQTDGAEPPRHTMTS